MFKKEGSKEKLEGLTCHARRPERVDPASVQGCAILGDSAHTPLPLSCVVRKATPPRTNPHWKWGTALRHGNRFDIAARWRDLTVSVCYFQGGSTFPVRLARGTHFYL